MSEPRFDLDSNVIVGELSDGIYRISELEGSDRKVGIVSRPKGYFLK